jgi:thiol-disulfide isomerase/thioredoxin
MQQYFNTHSLVISALALVAVVGFFLLRDKPKWNDVLAFGVIIIGLAAAWFALRPTQTPLMESSAKVQAMIGAGTPVLLEFQSPYCLACTMVKPVVDGLEQELAGQVEFIRLNIQDEVGQELAPLYSFEYTPTFIFFDAQGNEVWREVGRLDPQRVRDSLK